MKKIHKITILVASLVAVTGGYIFRDSPLFDGLTSSVLTVPTSFVCTESNLQGQSATYRQIQTRHKKALVIQKTLETQIAAKTSESVSGEIKNPEETLKLLRRQILSYARFIKAYEICQKGINLQPSVFVGVMSGEAKVIPAIHDYQELAGFDITSPNNLNTSLESLQFRVRIAPESSVVIDQWFLIADGNPSLCQSFLSGDTMEVDCTMMDGIPTNITQNSTGKYTLGAHIVSVDQTVTGSMEIAVSGLVFNEGRSTFDNKTTPILLQYGLNQKQDTKTSESEKDPAVTTPEITADTLNTPAVIPAASDILPATESSANTGSVQNSTDVPSDTTPATI